MFGALARLFAPRRRPMPQAFDAGQVWLRSITRSAQSTGRYPRRAHIHLVPPPIFEPDLQRWYAQLLPQRHDADGRKRPIREVIDG
jgi:hypothetical protein